MNFSNLFGAFKAVGAGKQLANSATWKNVQIATNYLVVVLGAAVPFLPEKYALSSDQVLSLATGIAVIGGVFNSYLTAATSKSVGLLPVNQVADSTPTNPTDFITGK
jgi:hypothetical protein